MIGLVLRLGVLLLAVASAAALVPAAEIPGVIGADERTMLDTSEWPWRAIGRLNREGGGFCTGTVVAPDLVLTAAHCLVDRRTGRRVAPETVHFLAGYRRGEWVGHGVGHAYVLPPGPEPGPEPAADPPPAPAPRTGRNPMADWALVVLKRPMAVRPVPVARLPTEDLTGVRVSRAGYGRDRPHLLSLHRDCAIAEQSAERLVHTCDATHGESGSPLLVHGEGRWSVVGIATGIGRSGQGGPGFGLGVAARAFAPAIRGRRGPER